MAHNILNTKCTEKRKNIISNNPIKKEVQIQTDFSKDDTQVAKKHLKKCSRFLAMREIQIKNTLKFHFTPVRIAKIHRTSDSSCWRCLAVRVIAECKNLDSHFGNHCGGSLGKMRVDLPQDSTILLLGQHPKDVSWYHIDTYLIIFIAILFITSQIWKQPRSLSVDGLTNNM